MNNVILTNQDGAASNFEYLNKFGTWCRVSLVDGSSLGLELPNGKTIKIVLGEGRTPKTYYSGLRSIINLLIEIDNDGEDDLEFQVIKAEGISNINAEENCIDKGVQIIFPARNATCCGIKFFSVVKDSDMEFGYCEEKTPLVGGLAKKYLHGAGLNHYLQVIVPSERVQDGSRTRFSNWRRENLLSQGWKLGFVNQIQGNRVEGTLECRIPYVYLPSKEGEEYYDTHEEAINQVRKHLTRMELI